MRRGLFGFAFLLLVIAIPLGVIMGGIVRDTARHHTIQEVLQEQMTAQGRELVDLEHRTEQGRLLVVATVRSVEQLEEPVVDSIAGALRGRLERPVTLEVVTLPVVRSSD
jgi:hypothetical protein